MALDYSLEIGTPTQIAVLAQELCGVPEYEYTDGGILAPSLQVTLAHPARFEIEVIEGEFGFTPTARVSFRLNKEAEPETAHTSLLRGCMALLKDGFGDAVLLFNFETVIFVRRNSSFVLNQLDGFWTDGVLATIPGPYEVRRMPII